jgi:hypothetical protein
MAVTEMHEVRAACAGRSVWRPGRGPVQPAPDTWSPRIAMDLPRRGRYARGVEATLFLPLRRLRDETGAQRVR